MVFNFKTATDEERKKEVERISQESGDANVGAKKEIAFMPEALNDNEVVITFTSGFMGNNVWLIILTDSRIICLDKGLLFGLKQEIIPLDKVSSISFETGLVMGEIKIIEGSNKRKITHVAKTAVRVFVDKTQQAINNLKNIKTESISNNNDKYAKLEQLAQLKEKGIITQEEFEKEKTKILA